MGFWSGLAKVAGAAAPIVAAPFTGGASLTALPAILGAGGAALGALSQSQASNRGTQMDADLAQADMRERQDDGFMRRLLAREQEGRAGGTDALRKLQQTEHIANSTTGYSPATVGGKQLPTFGFGPRASTAREIEGATGLGDEAMGRLTGGNPIPEVAAPTPFSFANRDPGFWERLAGIAGPAATFAGMAMGERQQPMNFNRLAMNARPTDLRG